MIFISVVDCEILVASLRHKKLFKYPCHVVRRDTINSKDQRRLIIASYFFQINTSLFNIEDSQYLMGRVIITAYLYSKPTLKHLLKYYLQIAMYNTPRWRLEFYYAYTTILLSMYTGPYKLIHLLAAFNY